MQSAEEDGILLRARAVLVDPESMTVLWMNEAAAEDAGCGSGVGAPVAQAVPLAQMMGVPEALRAVAQDGVARHLRTNLVSTSRGSVAIATSIYRLPDGKLLMLTEHAWQAERAGAGRSAQRGSRHRAF